MAKGGESGYSIARLLREEGIVVNRSGVVKFLKRFEKTRSIGRKPGSSRPGKITQSLLEIVETQMRADDETTAVQLHTMLVKKGFDVSLRTVLRSRIQLGWTFRGSAYCQLIRDVNKEKRLVFAENYLEDAMNDKFTDVVWTDECSVQLELGFVARR